jgi:hypothetical protein
VQRRRLAPRITDEKIRQTRVKYDDNPMGFTDVCLVWLANALGTVEVLTVDRRRYSLLPQRQGRPFRALRERCRVKWLSAPAPVLLPRPKKLVARQLRGCHIGKGPCQINWAYQFC